MPASQSPPPETAPRDLRAVAAVGVVGGVALIAIAITGNADSGPAWAAGILVAALTAALLYALARRPAETAAPLDPFSAPPPTPMAEPRYRLVLEALPDPVLLTAAVEPDDIAGPRVLFANAAAREMLRLQQEGGLLAAAIRNPRVLETVDEALFGAIAAETTFEPRGAQERTWRVMAQPLPPEGHQRLAVVLIRDETDARRNERMRADFLANASHELRTPLASLTGFIETLRGHAKDDPKARDRFLAIMGAQAERMARLIADLMSLSRIELNEHIAPSAEVDLSVAVMDVLDATSPIAAERQVKLEPRLPPPGRALVVGDRDQIIQVIQNLVDNGMKYSGADGVVAIVVDTDLTAEQAAAPHRPNTARLSLLSPDHAQGRRYAALWVKDSGPGIAREHLPRLSERFYRVEGQKSGERQGTGLGLAIVKHIVNRHRGGLAVESAEGEGAAFTAYFPMAPAPAASSRPPAAEALS